jgi:hypothetical protein
LVAQGGIDKGADGGKRIADVIGTGLDVVEQRRPLATQQLGDHRALVGEILVERADAHTRALRDPVGRERRCAILLQNASRRLDDGRLGGAGAGLTGLFSGLMRLGHRRFRYAS